MIHRLGRAALICTLCLSLGGQWLALQSIAWTAMLVRNARHEPLAAAVARTFDGAHPCGLCHAVAAGKKSEQKSSALPAMAKMDLICLVRPLRVEPPAVPYSYPRTLFTFAEGSLAPPVPPPRSLLA